MSNDWDEASMVLKESGASTDIYEYPRIIIWRMGIFFYARDMVSIGCHPRMDI